MSRDVVHSVTFMALILCGCGAQSSDGDSSTVTTFDHSMFAKPSFVIDVRSQGVGVPYARVCVVDAMTPSSQDSIEEEIESSIGGGVYFQGLTDEQGRVQGEFRIPRHVEEVDVVVVKRGFRGPYTHEALREIWGVFAPASRVTVSTDDGGIQVDLDEI